MGYKRITGCIAGMREDDAICRFNVYCSCLLDAINAQGDLFYRSKVNSAASAFHHSVGSAQHHKLAIRQEANAVAHGDLRAVLRQAK